MAMKIVPVPSVNMFPKLKRLWNVGWTIEKMTARTIIR
jgi:hypothetical protein